MQTFSVFSHSCLSEIKYQITSPSSKNNIEAITQNQASISYEDLCGETHSETQRCNHTRCYHSGPVEFVQSLLLESYQMSIAKFTIKNNILVLSNHQNTIYRPPIV